MTSMALTIRTLAFLCYCINNAFSFHSTTIAFPKNAVSKVKISINIVNPLDTPVNVNISAPRISSFTTKQELVPPKDVIVIELDKTDFEITGTGVSDKGILITSTVSDLIITGLSIAWNSGDMYFARKASQLCTEYIIITHCERDGICQFVAIGRENETVLEIMFPLYFAASVVVDGEMYGPGDVITVTLQETQTFQVESMSDLSGVKITSTNEKNISVLCGSSFTSVKISNGRDYLADMVPPIAAWKSEYVLVRHNLRKPFYDYVKLAAAASGANISIIGCCSVLYHQIQEFQIYSFNMTCERVHVISDKPILLADFPIGGDYGDPAMFFPTPIDHYVSKYTVYIPPGFRSCSIAFITETRHANTFKLNKFVDSFTDWEEIDQSIYSTAWVFDVKSSIIEINHKLPFGGHVICDLQWVAVAFPIGLGNVILNERQEYSLPSTIAESSTAPNDNETLINATSTSSPTASKDDTVRTTDVSMAVNKASGITTVQAHVNVREPGMNCSCCIMPSYSDSEFPPSEIISEITNSIKKSLLVPKKTTSKYVGKLTCAWDGRTSSAALGSLGITVLCVVFGSIITIDIITICLKSTSYSPLNQMFELCRWMPIDIYYEYRRLCMLCK